MPTVLLSFSITKPKLQTNTAKVAASNYLLIFFDHGKSTLENRFVNENSVLATFGKYFSTLPLAESSFHYKYFVKRFFGS